MSYSHPYGDLRNFPNCRIPAGQTLFRSVTTGYTPWWFASNGEHRFDLGPPAGTCYLAINMKTAILERSRKRTASTGCISRAFAAEMHVYELQLPETTMAADTASEDGDSFGVPRTIATITDYTITCDWARAFSDAGFGGITYQSQFTSGRDWNALALFGQEGDARWDFVRLIQGFEAIIEAGLGHMINDAAPIREITIKRPPPPLNP